MATYRVRREFDHLLQRELRAHVAVHDEEGVGVAGEDAVAEVVDAAGGAERRVLLRGGPAGSGKFLSGTLPGSFQTYLQVADGQPGVLLSHPLDEGGEVGVGVGAQYEHLQGDGSLGVITLA